MAQIKSKKFTLLILTSGLSFLIVGISWLFFERSLLQTSDASAIATVEFSEGKSTIQRKETMIEVDAKPGTIVNTLDKIKTGNESSLILNTLNGSQIRVDQNTTLTIERKAEKELVTVLIGHTQTLKHAGNIEIQNTQEKWRSTTIQTQISVKEVKAMAAKKTEPKHQATVQPATSDEQNLKNTLDGQKTFFNRCFAKHVVQNPDASGDIILGFLLLPQGKISNTRVLSSSFKDPELEKCLTSVIERSPFKRFAGDPISVTYPIRFD